MASPEELNKLLSDRIDSIMSQYFPNATKRGASYSMGDLEGNQGGSTGVFRGRGGIYLAKDSATDETVNILGLLHRTLGGTWSDTIAQAKKICGVADVERIAPVCKPKPPSEKRLPMRGTEAYKYLTEERGLQEKTLMAYDIRSHKRNSKHNEHFWSAKFVDTSGHYVFLKSTGIKKTPDGKKDIWSTKPYWTLWGWWLADANTREICITEGEIDAMSVHQMGMHCPVLSTPSGSSNLDWIGNDFERLEQFERIYLLTDMDEAGEIAAQKIAKRLGLTRCFRIELPVGYKDANDFLLSKEANKPHLKGLVELAKTYDPKTMVSAEETISSAIQRNDEMQEATKHRNFLFPSLDFKLIGKDTGILTGMIGHGKTDFGNCMMLNEIKCGEVVCIAAFDTPSDDLLRLCAWQMVGHDPEAQDIRNAGEHLKDKLYFIDGVNNSISAQGLLQDMEYAARRFGVTRFMIDNLSEVADIRKDDYDAQDRFVRSVDKFDKVNGTNTLIVAHSLMGDGCEWKIPARRDVEGSKGMVKPIQYGLTIFRNKVKEKPEEYDEGDNTRKSIKRLMDGDDVYFSVWKQRNGFREEFVQGLKYNKRSRTYALPYGRFESPLPLQVVQAEVEIDAPF
jgi:twinkle protein